jgi:hypothetical protein
LESFGFPYVQATVIGFLSVHLIHHAYVAYSYLRVSGAQGLLIRAIVAHDLFAEMAFGHDLADLDLFLAPRTLFRFSCSHN